MSPTKEIIGTLANLYVLWMKNETSPHQGRRETKIYREILETQIREQEKLLRLFEAREAESCQ